MALATALFIPLAVAGHPVITGTWRLDVAASNFGSMPPPESGVLAISTGPHKMFRIALFLQDPGKQRTVESEWKIDNRYHPVEGEGSGEVLAKRDGSMLVGKRLLQNGIEETRFRLEPGGETLTESIQSGTNLTTLIWRHQ